MERGEESEVDRAHDPRFVERGSYPQDHGQGHLQDDQVKMSAAVNLSGGG